jgi:REP element-mobilizing transposase RayT
MSPALSRRVLPKAPFSRLARPLLAMARMPRVEFDGALHHLLCRGDRREAIFLDDKDRKIFLATLGEICQRNAWRVNAYVLMSNHYHLLVETPKANLMRGLQAPGGRRLPCIC